MPRWLRLSPSGHVHCIVMRDPGSASVWLTACGRYLSEDHLTDDYPPMATRCPRCVKSVGPDA